MPVSTVLRALNPPVPEARRQCPTQSEVSIHLNQFVHASTGRMRVGIDKTGSDKHAFSVHNFSAASGQGSDICTGTNGQKTVSLDGEGLCAGVFRIAGKHSGVDDDVVRCSAPQICLRLCENRLAWKTSPAAASAELEPINFLLESFRIDASCQVTVSRVCRLRNRPLLILDCVSL